MQDNPKILIVGAGPGRNALALALSTACLDIITPEQVKKRGVQINQQPEPLPYVIQKAPEFPEQKSLIPFKEQKNYITGKKLPQKKRRK